MDNADHSNVAKSATHLHLLSGFTHIRSSEDVPHDASQGLVLGDWYLMASGASFFAYPLVGATLLSFELFNDACWCSAQQAGKSGFSPVLWQLVLPCVADVGTRAVSEYLGVGTEESTPKHVASVVVSGIHTLVSGARGYLIVAYRQQSGLQDGIASKLSTFCVTCVPELVACSGVRLLAAVAHAITSGDAEAALWASPPKLDDASSEPTFGTWIWSTESCGRGAAFREFQVRSPDHSGAMALLFFSYLTLCVGLLEVLRMQTEVAIALVIVTAARMPAKILHFETRKTADKLKVRGFVLCCAQAQSSSYRRSSTAGDHTSLRGWRLRQTGACAGSRVSASAPP